jgi:hypothetical protein
LRASSGARRPKGMPNSCSHCIGRKLMSA